MEIDWEWDKDLDIKMTTEMPSSDILMGENLCEKLEKLLEEYSNERKIEIK